MKVTDHSPGLGEDVQDDREDQVSRDHPSDPGDQWQGEAQHVHQDRKDIQGRTNSLKDRVGQVAAPRYEVGESDVAGKGT